MSRNRSFLVQATSLTMLACLLTVGLSLPTHAAPGESPRKALLFDALAADPLFARKKSTDSFLRSMCLLTEGVLLETLEAEKALHQMWGEPDEGLAIIEICFDESLTTKARNALIAEKYQSWEGYQYARNGDKNEYKVPSLISSLAHLGSATAPEALVLLAEAGNSEALKARMSFRAKPLSPRTSFSLHQTAVRNGAMPYWDNDILSAIEQCLSVLPFDFEYFAAYHELDQGAFNWELAEQAANTSRFGSPDTELALQLICSGLPDYGFSQRAFEMAVAALYSGIQTGTSGGFDICNFVTGRPGEAFCAERERAEEEAKLAKAKIPFSGMRVEEDKWDNWINPKNGTPIPGSCLETEWISGDNMDAYIDHFSLADGPFRRNPGRYMGSDPNSYPKSAEVQCRNDRCSIPANHAVSLEPFFYAEWEIEIPSLAQKFGDCKVEDPAGYKLKILWPSSSPACSALLPQMDSCHSMAYLEMSGMFGPYYNIYALVTHQGQDYVVLVTNSSNIEELQSAGILPQ